MVHSTIRKALQRAHGEPATPISGQDGLVKAKTPNNRDIRKSMMHQKKPEVTYRSAPRLGDSETITILCMNFLQVGLEVLMRKKEAGKTRQE